MATLTILTPTLSDQDLGLTATAEAGDQVLNDGNIILIFQNLNASDRTITMATGGTVKTSSGSLAIADVTLTISQNEIKAIGPFDPNAFNDSSGYLQLTYDAHEDLNVRPVRVT